MANSAEQLELFSRKPAALPDYSIRESSRARHVSIKVTLQGAVEIVVPKGFNLDHIPAIVQRREDWIRKTILRLQVQKTSLEPEHFETQPTALELRACDETWQVLYSPGEGPLALNQSAPKILALRGSTTEAAACADLLRQWLTHKARAKFAPWLRELSFDIGLPFNRLSIRGQKTRWASCSSKRNVSLNYKLLFLPSNLVHYVFVHELCHTVHMDHSASFWELVGKKLPTYSACRRALREGWRYVPRWVERE